VPAQLPLFSSVPAGPQGLQYEQDFITASQEQQLITHIRELPLAPFQFGEFEGKRRVAYFGASYDFTHQRLASADPMPAWLMPLATKVENFSGLQPRDIAHALVTEYDIGAGIGWHRDKKEFGLVFGVSLGSPCPFRFRRKAGARWVRFTLDAQPRSLYVMSGEARYDWEHSIAPVGAQRYSITFRTIA
jgi:alkylated DNA repair dioxygenase AlkB